MQEVRENRHRVKAKERGGQQMCVGAVKKPRSEQRRSTRKKKKKEKG